MSKETTYSSIQNPYDNNLQRSSNSSDAVSVGDSSSGSSDGGSSGGSNSGTTVSNAAAETSSNTATIIGDSLSDLYLETWIKSRNYQPKVQGILIDGRTGYFEAQKAVITGDITAETGYIGGTTGWTIAAGSISSINGSNTTTLSSGGTNAFIAGPTILPTITISHAGVLTATGAVISGTLTATAGFIGGWTINTTSITDTAGTVGLSSAITVGDDIRFWAGHATPASAPFKVTEAGVLTATSGTIGGWTLGSTSLTGTGVTLSSTGDAYLAIGTTPPTGVSTGTGIFINKTGLFGLNANTQNFKIDATNGNITSIAGTIGGWTISATALSTGTFDTLNTMYFGSSGLSLSDVFKVTAAGALTATSATITGAITATSGTIGSFTIGTYLYTGTKTAYNDTNAGVHLGSDGIGIANNLFTVSSAGVITAVSGTIGGCTLGTTSIGSTAFVSGSAGWNISNAGTAEFENIIARGEFRTAVFVKDEIHATGGSLIILSASTLKADFTSVTTPTTSTLDLTDPPSGHAQLFSVNDIIRIKDGSGKDNWLKVTVASDQTTFYRYTVDKQSGTNGTFTAGTAVVNYKQSADGHILLTSDATSSPYIDIALNGATPWTASTLDTKVRLGWLQGITDADVGLATTDIWGLYSDNVYLKGVIVANTGYIGGTTGWAIAAGSISSVNGGNTTTMASGGSNAYIAGTTGSPQFIVTHAGALTATSASITGSVTATSGSIGSFTIGTYLYTGTKTAYNDTNAGIHLGSDGIGIGNNIFTVSSVGALIATSATITGAITATSGAIGGWTVDSTSIKDTAGLVGMSSAITIGDDIRFWAGHATPASAPFKVTEAGALTATSGSIGGWTLGATALTSGTGATTVGVDSGGTNPAFYAGSATPGSAPFRVTQAGALTASSATITGALTTSAGSSLDGQYLTTASVASTSANLALRGWTFTGIFSSSDSDTVAWTAGTFTASDGTAYSILLGNTGNMVVLTYIYLDIAVSTTILQTTTTAATAIGNGKVLIAIAQNQTSRATFQVFGGSGGNNLLVDNLVANSASTNEFISNTAQIANLIVTDAKINTLGVAKLTAGTINSQSIVLGITGGAGDVEIRAGIATGDFANAGAASGFIIGLDDSDSDKPKFYFGTPTSYIKYDGTTVDIVGTLTATVGSIGGWSISSTAIYFDGATDALSAGMAIADFPFYAGKKYADRATAPFRITPAGALTATSATITGALTTSAGSSIDGQYLASGSVASVSANLALRGWTQTCVFSSTDLNTVSWGAGVLTASDGTAYNIGIGNTGDMSARTYIYLDIAVSTIAYQTTTTAATAIGNGKVLVAVAENSTSVAEFQVFGGIGGIKLLVDDIAANSASTNEFVANTANISNAIITDAKIADLAVSKLTAGTITSKAITLAVSAGTGDAKMQAGMTDFGDTTNSGFIIGIDDSDGDKGKLYLGNGADTSKLMYYDGTDLIVNDSIITNEDKYGDGSDGDVTISAGTTTLTSDMYCNDLLSEDGSILNPAGYRMFIKGTWTRNGTGKIACNGNAGSAGTDRTDGGAGGAGGAALADAYLKGSLIGAAGGAAGAANTNGTAGVAGSNLTNSLGVNGVAGGAGGDVKTPGSTGGGGGAAGTVTSQQEVHQATDLILNIDFYNVASFVKFTSSASSGGGGGGGNANNNNNPGAGGGAGSSGRIVLVCVRKIVDNGSGVLISANGGAGGRGGAANSGQAGEGQGAGGGGGGGSGGVVILIYSSKIGSGTFVATGGAGGAGGIADSDSTGPANAGQQGDAGTDGLTGTVIQLQI